MQIDGKTDEQILSEADRSLRSNKWQAIGIVVLIFAGLSKGWTVHLESEIENATTVEIVLQHQADDCSKRRFSDGNTSHCDQMIEAQTAARRLVGSLRTDLPNVVLLSVFGSGHSAPTK